MDTQQMRALARRNTFLNDYAVPACNTALSAALRGDDTDAMVAAQRDYIDALEEALDYLIDHVRGASTDLLDGLK